MAKLGAFDKELRDTSWFDPELVSEGWFDPEMVLNGGQSITLGLITQTATPFAPTVTSVRVVAVGLIIQTAATFAPIVTPGVTLGRITQTAATFSPTVTSLATISVGLINQTAAAFAPYVGLAAEIKIDNPTSWWRLDELAGATATDIVSGRNGTYVNSPALGASSLIETDPTNTAVGFTKASSQYVSVADNPAFSVPTTGELTIELWFNITTRILSNFMGLASKHDTGGSTNREYGIYVTTGGDVVVELYNSGGTTIAAASAGNESYADNFRHHLVATIKDSTTELLLYLNGALVGSDATWSGVTFNGPGDFYIARLFALNYPTATVDEVVVYDHVLSPTRVAVHARAANNDQVLVLPRIQVLATAHAPTVASVWNVAPAIIDQTAVPFAPTITTGVAAVSVGLINQAAATFSPTITSTVDVSVGLIDQTATTFAPTITTTATISVALLNQTATPHAPTITSVATISLALIDRTAVAFVPYIPGYPTWTTPADGALLADTTPTLAFLMPYTISPMHFQIEIDDDSGFGSPTVYDSFIDQTGWEYWDGAAWQVVASGGVSETFSGNEARHTVQTPLAADTYYRRVRAGEPA